MSRVLHLNATAEVVTATCDKHSIGVSVIEPLASGGVRIVLSTLLGAEALRKRMGTKVINGPVVRSPLHTSRSTIPYR